VPLTSVDEPRSALDVLEWTRLTITPHLESAIAPLPAAERRVAEHGFDSMLRPALALLAAEAVGGPPAHAAATAVELAHLHCQLHDDVVHGVTTRRERATAWTVFGTESTTEAANAALELAFRVLAGNERAVRTLNTSLLAIVDGEIEDADLDAPGPPDLAACVRRATAAGSLMACACALGAMFGGGSRAQVEHLRAFGSHVGLVFQHVEDVLGIWGEPLHGDLLRRRRSLPVVAAMRSGTAAGRSLITLYRGEGPLSEEDAQCAAELVEEAGGRTWCLREVDTLLVRALHRLRASQPGAKAADELFALARQAARHDH